MNIEELKDRCIKSSKRKIRKDSIKLLLSKEELQYIQDYYGFDLDNSTKLFALFCNNIHFNIHCETCNSKLDLKRIESCIKHKCHFYCSRSCNINYQNIDYIKRTEKTKKTNLEKYGVENVSHLDSVKDKISQKVRESSNKALNSRKKTNLEKYGVEHVLQCKEIKDSQENSMLIRYGDRYSFRIKEFKIKASNTCMKKYGVPWSTYLIKPKLYSKAEVEIINFIKSLLNVKIIQHDRNILSGYELDIYIPEKNLAIEFNGIYWHSNLYKDKNYHLDKTEECEKKGIQLLHIFENEWVDPVKREIWKSLIKHKLGLTETKIPARKCILKEISNKEASDFCNRNHLQSGIVGSINLGLFYNNELVQVAIISKPRYTKQFDYELLRLCSKLNTIVIGGASKILKGYSNLVSYANRRWSIGGVYKSSGFRYINKSKPNYFYIIDGILESRIGWQKHKLKDKLKYFNESLTEHENMSKNGYFWIYDCGNLVFVKE